VVESLLLGGWLVLFWLDLFNTPFREDASGVLESERGLDARAFMMVWCGTESLENVLFRCLKNDVGARNDKKGVDDCDVDSSAATDRNGCCC
jgi:hypothetical protein